MGHDEWQFCRWVISSTAMFLRMQTPLSREHRNKVATSRTEPLPALGSNRNDMFTSPLCTCPCVSVASNPSVHVKFMYSYLLTWRSWKKGTCQIEFPCVGCVFGPFESFRIAELDAPFELSFLFREFGRYLKVCRLLKYCG